MPSFNERNIARYLKEVEIVGVASIPDFLKSGTRLALLRELERYSLELVPDEYGEYGVQQAFSAITSFPRNSLFLQVRNALEECLTNVFLEVQREYLSESINFSSLVVQRYEPGPIGITTHRDGHRFINLIAIFVLEGHGKFYVCDDLNGTNAQEIRNEPGDLLLMRGPGFLGSDHQPFHSVGDITVRRTSFSLRHVK